MADADDRLDAALRIIEDYPNLHMGPTVSFVLGALQQPIGGAPESAQAGRDKLKRLRPQTGRLDGATSSRPEIWGREH